MLKYAILVLGIILLVFAVIRLIQNRMLLSYNREVMGKVVGRDESGPEKVRRGNRHQQLLISYYAKGKVYETIISVPEADTFHLIAGSRVTLLYQKAKPWKAILAADAELKSTVWFFLSGVIIVALGVIV